MRLMMMGGLMAAAATVAQAQSWSVQEDGGIALPRSTGGVNIEDARLDCTPRGWLLALPQDMPFGDGTGAPYGVILTIDGQDFQTMGDYATSEILIPDASIASIKAGFEMTLIIPSGSQMVQATFGLGGSDAALTDVEATCGT